MMKKWLQIIGSCSLIVFLLVATTSAWLLLGKEQSTDFIELIYGGDTENELVIAPKDIVMTIYTADDDGEYVPAPEEGFEIAHLLPGVSKHFRIYINNESSDQANIKLSLANIEGDPIVTNEEETNGSRKTGTLLDMLFISVRGTSGYIGGSVETPSLYKRMNVDCALNEFSNTYTVELFSSIIIPAGDFVVLNCYFYLDIEAGNEYQNKFLRIGTFRAER